MDNTLGGVGGGCHSLPETRGAGTPALTQAARQGPLLLGQLLSQAVVHLEGQAGAPALPSQGPLPATFHPKEGCADGGLLGLRQGAACPVLS